MEKVQAPINSHLLIDENHADEGYCLRGEDDDENGALSCLNYAQLHSLSNFRFEDYFHEEQTLAAATADPFDSSTYPSLFYDDRVPFLEMLQSVEYSSSPIFQLIHEPNLHYLLRLQQQNQVPKKLPTWESNCSFSSYFTCNDQIQQHQSHHQIESCVTNDMIEMASPVKSDLQIQPITDQNPKSKCNSFPAKSTPTATKERKKRKRTRPTKNKEEVENQRMTHIAVERNRRRQMNDHLSTLRSLMPPSYVQRGDQASVIGGAIDFVKELEQMLQSLQTQKRIQMRQLGEQVQTTSDTPVASTSSSSSSLSGATTTAAEVEAIVIQNHVNVKVECEQKCGRGGGQVAKVVLALEELRLTVLHLNITSGDCFVHYSFNLKMEDDCHLRSAEEITATVHQIFNLINAT
ncbi:hypothetical protein Droror1_Dr00000707 [Drosera rotundifolia]